MHIAVQSRNRDIAKVLLVNGADKTRRTKVNVFNFIFEGKIVPRNAELLFFFQDGITPLDLSLCFGKDFKSFDIAKLLKVLPANREL